MTATIKGTDYFTSLTAAIQYYAAYDYSAKDVQKKIDSKEIYIGRPFVPAGKKLVVSDSRYWLDKA